MTKTIPDIPRRCRLDLYSPGEIAIRQAMLAVEAMGASVALTDAVLLLSKAKDRVADFIDGVDLPEVGSASSIANQCKFPLWEDAPLKMKSEFMDALLNAVPHDTIERKFNAICKALAKATPPPPSMSEVKDVP